MKKHLVLIWLASVAAAYVALGSEPLPSFRKLPDYMVSDHCDPFSQDALRLLHRQGVPAHRVIFAWSRYGGASGYHAAVFFQWEGHFFYMDNEHRAPLLVTSKTELGCINQVAGNYFGAFRHMVDEPTAKRRAPRNMADMFAPNPAWLKQIQESR